MLHLGDRNTQYFHQKTLVQRRGNKIEALLNDHKEWVYDDTAIQQALVSYFYSLFSSNVSVNSILDTTYSYPRIEPSELQVSVDPISLEVVRCALFSMGNYKAPGPDDLHPLFFKSQREVVGPSIYNFVQQAFENPSSIGDINRTLLTLIPKVIEPFRPSDFMPIALCNVIYKIITEVLANRIKPILPSIIFQNQSSFITTRNATDNAIIL